MQLFTFTLHLLGSGVRGGRGRQIALDSGQRWTVVALAFSCKVLCKIAGKTATMEVELAAFVTSHFLWGRDWTHRSDPASRAEVRRQGGPCDAQVCTLLLWIRQAHALAVRVAALTGEGMSVHAFTECLDPAAGEFVYGATDIDDDGKY